MHIVNFQINAESLLDCLRVIADTPQDILCRIPGMPKSISELEEMIMIENESNAAVSTFEPIIRFKPTDRLNELLTTARALKVEASIREKARGIERD